METALSTPARKAWPGLGFVVIGRNEGERLQRCLRSIDASSAPCVYVDSGSTDGSPNAGKAAGAEVVQLDMSRPFTAARARNEGFRRLQEIAPAASLVMFVDGDCEVAEGWTDQAAAFLQGHPEVAAVAGRRRERAPEASVFNRLCDLEWNTPIGEARAVGGDAMMRVACLNQVGGYREDLIAGEEPELCVRLRQQGWKIWRLDTEMSLHDAAMTRWSQWWRRTVRSGYAFAEGAFLHGASPEHHFAAESRRALVWGVLAPLAFVILGLKLAAAWALWLIYPLQVARLAIRFSKAGTKSPWVYALFLVLGRFPEAQGGLKFWWGRLRGQGSRIIEYK
jgi:GT2 family glycosyltransferase